MKRFATVICLAASLVFLFGVTAMAANVMTVQSRNVAMGASTTIGIKSTNDLDLFTMVVPLIIREVDPGSFIATTGGLSFPPNGRVPGNRMNLTDGAIRGIKTANRYSTQLDGDCKEGLPGGFRYPTLPAFTGPWTSPAAVLFVCSVFDPTDPLDFCLAVGTDGGDGALQLNLTVNNTPGRFEIDTTCTTAANHLTWIPCDTLFPGYTPTFEKGIVTIMANQCPTGSAPDPAPVTAGAAVTTTVVGVDPDLPPDAITYAMVPGSKGSVNPTTGKWDYTTVACADVPGFDVYIYVSDPPQHAQNACAIDTFHVTVNPPALNVGACADVIAHVNTLAEKQVVVSGGCTPYTFSGGAPGSVDQQGHWTYQATCELINTPVSITVTDDVGQTKTCDFNLTVTNAAPVCGTTADVVVSGSRTLGATDADDVLSFFLVSGTSWVGPPAENITGNVYNSGPRPAGDVLDYVITYGATDGCDTIYCTFKVIFEPPCLVSIVDLDTAGNAILPADYAHSFGGENHTVGVYFDQMPGLIGGFDLLICYDQSLLRFIKADRGNDLNPLWEYFTYRTGQFGGNCGGGCPNGYVKLVGIADMNNGVTITDQSVFALQGVIVELTFYVDGNTLNIGLCPHIGFCSFDCTDNVLSSKDGTIAWLIMAGASLSPDYDSAFCMLGMPNKPGPRIPLGKFCPGAICIDRPEDDRGDINQNGVANEIGDAVLFSNAFIYGVNVAFYNPDRRPAQILATDINNDGLTLTVADLVYLIRIITGDAQPFPPLGGGPKLSPFANSVDVNSNVTDGALTVTTKATVDLGGALFVYRYSGLTVGQPVLTAGSNLQIRSVADRGELRILVYGMASGAKVQAGLNNLVTVPVSGNGTIELAESQVSDYEGALLTVNATAKTVPSTYALLQNYPNPFNAGTVIQFSLKDQTNWNLSIYNIAGQIVRTFSGNGQGSVSVAWDGTSEGGSTIASGMYFYRLSTKEFTATKKMVLMK